MFKKGDIVSRKKYGHDIVFKVDKVEGNIVYLKGIDVRLCADTDVNDLVYVKINKKKEEIVKVRSVDTDNFFFIPGVILHIDSDKDFINKCMEYYKSQNIKAYSYYSLEKNFSKNVSGLIEKYNPSIVVITGHDAIFKNKKNNKYYKNSDYFIDAVIEIRKKYKNIVIFAGACQSNFESLIKSGASYASSPSRINIHALDPAIVASYIALTDINETVDIKDLINKTHYKEDGIGGLIIKGKMISGYPRGGNDEYRAH